MSLTSWFLVSGGGIRHRLPREMIFVGRDDCELMLQSRSVDKQHAVINYEPTTDEHKVKDLGSLNGTFVNDNRIQEQQYITLKIDDKLRFGYHEKFSSQLQLAKKPSSTADSYRNFEAAGAEGHKERVVKLQEPSPKREEKMTGDTAVVPRGTPLYGQPSWWGDADDVKSAKNETKTYDPEQFKWEAGDNSVAKEQVVPETMAQTDSAPKPSYLEIPSKEAIPDVEDLPMIQGTTATTTNPAPEGSNHGHASFTIEFNTVATGKGKERNTKCVQGHRSRPKRGAGEELSALQVAMVAAEVKVADWLAQNDLPLALSESLPEEDGDSVKSDVPVQLRSLKGSKHEDGTQSDSENTLSAQLSNQRASLQDQSRPDVQRTEEVFCSSGNFFQNKPSAISKKMVPVGGEEEQTRSYSFPFMTTREKCEPQERLQWSLADDQSDRGTYTVELETSNTEEEEARHMIDKVLRVEDNQTMTMLHYPQYQKDREGVWLKSAAVESRNIGHAGLLADDLVVVGGPRWVSQWTSLAASHKRTDPEGSGAECTMTGTDEKGHNNETNVTRSSIYPPSYQSQHKQAIPQESSENFEMDKVTTEGQHRQAVSSSEKQYQEFQDKTNQYHELSRARVANVSPPSIDRTRVSKQAARKKAFELIPHVSPESVEKSKNRETKGKGEEKMTSGKALLRQESFTVERPSANVPMELIPCIDGSSTTNHTEMGSISVGTNAATLLKDSESVAVFLETTLSDVADPSSFSLEGSVSPESDIDTTSTVSQAGREKRSRVAEKKCSVSGPVRVTSKITSSTKVKHHPPVQNRSNSCAWASLDLTDDDLNSPLSQDTHAEQVHSSSKTVRLRSEASSSRTKEGKTKTATPAFSSFTPASMSQPRPTRASLLRRARLGDTSDTDLADMDRVSVASEASTASSASRPSAGQRTLSRIEVLAQPRRPRVSSPSARSDSETTSGKIRRLSSKSGQNGTLHLGVPSSTMAVPRARANSASKLPDKLTRKSFDRGTIAAGTRWQRVPVEYASTSEDEFGSNRHPTKHTRPKPIAPRVTQLGGSAPATPSPGGISMLRHQSSRDQDDYMRDWTAHSEEIARISQDLAKDLAMLAQEIHDVAGEIDSASPSSAPSALVAEHVFVDGQSSAPDNNGTAVEVRSRCTSNQERRAIRCQTWNKDEAVLDSLLLASVSQLSAKIRREMDKTANKIRILFKDKDKKWGELDSKLGTENEVPLLKTSNQEITSVLQDLKRVERQLFVIDIMVDPDGTLDALSNLGITSPLATEIRVSPNSENPGGSQQAGDTSCNTSLPFPALSEVTEQERGLHLMSTIKNNASQK